MTYNTPLNVDELRDLLHGDIQSALGFADIREWGTEGREDYEKMLDIVMERIVADRKKHELEARIDEWKTMGDFLTKADKVALSREFLDLYRLHGERLKAERVKL